MNQSPDGRNLLAAMRGVPHSHVPLYLFDITLGMEVAGLGTDEVFIPRFDGERSARSLLALNRLLGTDGINGSVMWSDARLFGSEVAYPKDGIPYIVRTPIREDPSRLYGMDANVVSGDFAEQTVLSYRLVREGTDAALFHHVPSVFGSSSSFRGLENILMDMILEKDFVRDLMDFSYDIVKILSKAVYDSVDVDVTLISGAYDNIDISGYDLLNEFSTPALKEEISFLRDSGSLICFHPHGELSSPDAAGLLDDYIDIGVENLYYGENNDPLIIHERIPKMPLMGGIDTFTTIVLGNEDRVRNDTAECVDRMKDIDYTFACSCSVDRGLPLNKIETMVRTVRDHGRRE